MSLHITFWGKLSKTLAVTGNLKKIIIKNICGERDKSVII